MADSSPRLHRVIVAATVAATAAVTVTFLSAYPRFSLPWLWALLTLVGLALLSDLLALKITEGGSYTSMAFIPHLAAVLLLGPAGAVLVAVASWLFFQIVILRNPRHKVFFNVSQVTLAVFFASFIYRGLGGASTTTTIDFQATFPAFLAAAVTYFAINFSAVTYIISLSEARPLRSVWRNIGGNLGELLIFDFAVSILAYGVVFLYTQWGAFAVFLTVIPLIGLRYSHGVTIALRQLNRDLLKVLVKTLEAQDPYTSGHSIRVADGARLIAEELGLRRSDVDIIETAALLHDIGKIGNEFYEILRQKGPLTDQQRSLIRSHPERGAELISSVRSLSPEALRCIRHHHERFDGDGYPDGLGGHDIPLGARIIMVSDTIDAMSTVRPYREALPSHVIKEELKKHAGAQFDPDVVAVALKADLWQRLQNVTQTDTALA